VGAGGTSSSDPCSLADDGLHCGSDLPGQADPASLYDCFSGETQSVQRCAGGCSAGACGQDPCLGAADGLHCGGALVAGEASTVYECAGGVTVSQQVCPNGCQDNACAPDPGGCCIEEPPHPFTQAFSACGNGGSHYGRDYSAPIGTPIHAGVAGTVVSSALGYPNCYDNGCTGSCYNSFNYIKIKSACGDPLQPGNDLYLYYLHIDDLAPGIVDGAPVAEGQLVALSGNSGCSSGPHIHVETVSVPTGVTAYLSTCNSVDPASRYCP
jgi:hypothetical protein